MELARYLLSSWFFDFTPPSGIRPAEAIFTTGGSEDRGFGLL